MAKGRDNPPSSDLKDAKKKAARKALSKEEMEFALDTGDKAKEMAEFKPIERAMDFKDNAKSALEAGDRSDIAMMGRALDQGDENAATMGGTDMKTSPTATAGMLDQFDPAAGSVGGGPFGLGSPLRQAKTAAIKKAMGSEPSGGEGEMGAGENPHDLDLSEPAGPAGEPPEAPPAAGAPASKAATYGAEGDPYKYKLNEDNSVTILDGPTGKGMTLTTGPAYQAILGQISSGQLKLSGDPSNASMTEADVQRTTGQKPYTPAT